MCTRAVMPNVAKQIYFIVYIYTGTHIFTRSGMHVAVATLCTYLSPCTVNCTWKRHILVDKFSAKSACVLVSKHHLIRSAVSIVASVVSADIRLVMKRCLAATIVVFCCTVHTLMPCTNGKLQMSTFVCFPADFIRAKHMLYC
jgi:hypothetical protein